MEHPSDSRLSALEWAAIVTIIVVWGVNNAAAKFATEALPPLFVGGVRFLLALGLLFPFIRPPFPNWRIFLPVVICAGPLHFGLLYIAFAHIENLSLFGVTLQLWAPYTVLFAWLILGERLSRSAAAGVALAFVGCAIMTLDPHTVADLGAVVIGAIASSFWAFATVLVRKLPEVRALKIQGCTSLVAAPVLLALSFTLEPGLPEAARRASWFVWACVAFAGLVSTVGASALLFWLVQRRETGRVTPYLLATPLITALIGVTAFGDRLTWQLVAGALVAMGGVGLVAVEERRRTRLSAAAGVRGLLT
ncbi:MAG TPA: DMT family transporter [Caulobacteraceae bacterium]|jgi:O-acetylserine/cysteine efflux transporter